MRIRYPLLVLGALMLLVPSATGPPDRLQARTAADMATVSILPIAQTSPPYLAHDKTVFDARNCNTRTKNARISGFANNTDVYYSADVQATMVPNPSSDSEEISSSSPQHGESITTRGTLVDMAQSTLGKPEA